MGAAHKTYRIVIAKDESVAHASLQALLEAVGCTVVGLSHGRDEALELIRTLNPDCVLFAMQIDAPDGIEILSALHTAQLAPVVVISTSTQAKIIESAVKAGAYGYLTKPFQTKDILPALQLAMSRFAETRTLFEEVESLQEKLETRKLIEKAKGLLMKKGLSEADAHSRLQKLSMSTGKSLKELAQAVILSDALQS